MQWGQKKNEELKGFLKIFHRCHENNNLCLIILWDVVTKTPVAGSAILIDWDKHTYYGYMTG